MGFLGMVVANNFFEMAGAIALAIACYNLGMWKQRKYPTLELMTMRTAIIVIVVVVLVLFLLHLLFR